MSLRLPRSLGFVIACAGLAYSASAGITLTGGSIGGNAGASADTATAMFACADFAAPGSSCSNRLPGQFDVANDCDAEALSTFVNVGTQAPVQSNAGNATTSGGLGDLSNASAFASAWGFITADDSGARTGTLELTMCGSVTANGSTGAGGIGAEFNANINTNSIKFSVQLPAGDTNPVPFVEEYSGGGSFAQPAPGQFSIQPDTSFGATPGAIITGPDGRNYLAPGDYELDFFSETAGNRAIDRASFSEFYRLRMGDAVGLPEGACCIGSRCVVTIESQCGDGRWLGAGSTCDQCAEPCCQPWDNGRFDRRAAQSSQLAVGQDWRISERFAADDFWLCEGQIHHINTIKGQLTTNSDLPKALVIVWSDCDGQPDRPIAIAGLRNTAFELPSPEDHILLGDVVVTPTSDTFEGLTIVDVEARFDKLVLKGGAYWVSIVGFSADLDPLDEFFWGSAGNLIVKGRPGAVQLDEEWVDSDELCCGCTDYNFCVIGESCKILIDNGPPIENGNTFFPGVASLQNGQRTSDKSRASDKFVLPPCTNYAPCYVEGWLWTNCDRAGLQFVRGGCDCPPSGPLSNDYFISDCVVDTGITIADPSGRPVTLKKFQFFFNADMVRARLGGSPDIAGSNIHIVLFGLGDNRQNARAYFAAADRCDRACDLTFGPGCYKAAPADNNPWRSNDLVLNDQASFFPGFDHAFLIAVKDYNEQLPPPVVVDTCPADINRTGGVTVQDIFDFLASWFAGCP